MILDRITTKWRAQKIALNPGKSSQEVAALFAGLGQCAPADDVISLYAKFDGMQEMENDAGLRIWSLAEILAGNKEFSPYGIIFADHLMDSWVYRVKPETQSHSAVYIDYIDSTKVPVQLFNSLREFFAAYEKNPSAILGP